MQAKVMKMIVVCVCLAIIIKDRQQYENSPSSCSLFCSVCYLQTLQFLCPQHTHTMGIKWWSHLCEYVRKDCFPFCLRCRMKKKQFADLMSDMLCARCISGFYLRFYFITNSVFFFQPDSEKQQKIMYFGTNFSRIKKQRAWKQFLIFGKSVASCASECTIGATRDIKENRWINSFITITVAFDSQKRWFFSVVCALAIGTLEGGRERPQMWYVHKNLLHFAATKFVIRWKIARLLAILRFLIQFFFFFLSK